MTDLTNYGVPIVQVDRRFTVFNKEELYTTPTGKGSQVANPGDLIVDYINSSMERVIATDYTNYTYEVAAFNPIPVENSDSVIGGCAPSASNTFRVYINTAKHPMTMRIDGRMTIAAVDIDSVRVFRGKVIDDTGVVISGYYRDGVMVSDRIPMALVATDGNKSVKTAVAGVCTKEIENNDLVTLVYYAADGEPVAIAQCYVVKTNMVMAMEAPAKQVVSVKLISPFMSTSDDTLLQLPTNIPIDDIPLQVEVRYTDGTRRVTLDGSKARLDGLRNSGSHSTFYISSTIGQTLPLTLKYRLGSNETYLGEDLVGSVINKRYSAVTLEIDGSYSVKLFVVPRWLDVERGYRLDYYLYDLERGNVFDATAYVTKGVGGETFDPKLYGYKQRLVVRVDLSKISATYNAHIHPQSFHISLESPGNENQTNYLIDYIHDGDTYGEDIVALFRYSNTNFWTLDLSCGAASRTEWLQRLYFNSYPLYDRRSESAPPTPTHFQVLVKDKVYTRSVDTWMDSFNIEFQLTEGEVVLIKWISRTPQDELHLAMSPLLAHQVL